MAHDHYESLPPGYVPVDIDPLARSLVSDPSDSDGIGTDLVEVKHQGELLKRGIALDMLTLFADDMLGMKRALVIQPPVDLEHGEFSEISRYPALPWPQFQGTKLECRGVVVVRDSKQLLERRYRLHLPGAYYSWTDAPGVDLVEYRGNRRLEKGHSVQEIQGIHSLAERAFEEQPVSRIGRVHTALSRMLF